MITSPETNEICAALSKAQAVMPPAPFDKMNPHYKSKYASLVSHHDSSKKILGEHDLAVVQTLSCEVETGMFNCTTRLIHKSGQFFEDTMGCRPKDFSPQELGKAATYLRRYSYGAIIGQSSDDDDDGNSAKPDDGKKSAGEKKQAVSQPKPKPLTYEDTDECKRLLRDEAASVLVTDPELLRKIHKYCLGTEVKDLRMRIGEYLVTAQPTTVTAGESK